MCKWAIRCLWTEYRFADSVHFSCISFYRAPLHHIFSRTFLLHVLLVYSLLHGLYREEKGSRPVCQFGLFRVLESLSTMHHEEIVTMSVYKFSVWRRRVQNVVVHVDHRSSTVMTIDKRSVLPLKVQQQ